MSRRLDLAALGSAILLVLSFPPFPFWPLIFLVFLPLFYGALHAQTYRSVFFHFFLAGFFFYFVSVEWLRHVSYFGWVFVAVFQAVYFGLFGVSVQWVWKRGHFLLSLFMLPSVWTVLEWVRAEIPVWAFGWNLLGYSQAEHFLAAGLASAAGAYGVSWFVVFTNLVLFFILKWRLSRSAPDLKLARLSFLVLACGLAFVFAFDAMQRKAAATEEFLGRIAVIQSNIPQEEKWDPGRKAAILETHEGLSRFAAYDRPDLIIWPEAAFPGYFNRDPDRSRVFSLASELNVPILVGSPHMEFSSSEKEIAFNSAYLVTPPFENIERYDKVRLVPFGEFIPWSFLFRPLGLERLAYSLGVSDFYAGTRMHVFSPAPNRKFSVLICFEDIFPELARAAVRQGAQFLVVITNDAWFAKSAAPYQHLQASIFRAIENGVPVVRAANTGVSAFVSDRGKVLDRVKDQKGRDIFIGGGLVREVTRSRAITWYQRGGHYFPIFCLAFVAGAASWMLPRFRKH